MRALKIRKGDTVEMLSGKDRGKRGRVVNVYPKSDRVMVEGVNQVKRHERMRQVGGRGGVQGGIITKEMPVHISSVAVVCDSCGRPTRVGHEYDDNGQKERICRRCGGRL
ncbi:MAG TPA: 50S ribosomal protein L24 [Actinomycetota bacterium]|jgi:large subunit ribosomal protein L24